MHHFRFNLIIVPFYYFIIFNIVLAKFVKLYYMLHKARLHSFFSLFFSHSTYFIINNSIYNSISISEPSFKDKQMYGVFVH